MSSAGTASGTIRTGLSVAFAIARAAKWLSVQTSSTLSNPAAQRGGKIGSSQAQ
jgi:hypothetical protein